MEDQGGTSWFLDGTLPLPGGLNLDGSIGRDLEGGNGPRNGGLGLSSGFGGGGGPFASGLEFSW